MVTERFSNETDQAIDLMVEPWGMVELIPAGTKFAIHYDPPVDREDTSFAEYHSGMVRFWVEGDGYELDIGGERVPSRRPLSPHLRSFRRLLRSPHDLYRSQ